MPQTYDLVLRGGTIVDGTGRDASEGDIAVRGDRIVAVGRVESSGRRELDARGKLVTPGFIDMHTHYDGQAIWSDRLAPSSQHGVTTAVLGNCGVGFAPCRPDDRDALISVMEGVEDIPEVVMAAGLTWDWETFPQFMRALARRRRDIDVAAYLPHSPLRIFAMGARGAAREPATDDDLERMRGIVREALGAGAIGFASSRFGMHRSGKGDNIPSFEASVRELSAILGVMRENGRGLFQVALDAGADVARAELGMLEALAVDSRCPITFSLVQMNDDPDLWKSALAMTEAVNRHPGSRITAQVFPRPVSMIMGLQTSINPFSLCPSYASLRPRALADKVAAMRDPVLRQRLLEETPGDASNPIFRMSRNFEKVFALRDASDYEPRPSLSVAAQARTAGRKPEELIYDLLLEDEGRRLLYCAMANLADGTFQPIWTMLKHEHTAIGLGDGGAHYGFVSDASFPTFLLTHWSRDRQGERLTVPEAVHALTGRPAAVLRLADRGLLAPGYKADINVIDYERLRLEVPRMVHDLPGGGGRLMQAAVGYVATFVSGRAIAMDDAPTGELPGSVIRNAARH